MVAERLVAHATQDGAEPRDYAVRKVLTMENLSAEVILDAFGSIAVLRPQRQ